MLVITKIFLLFIVCCHEWPSLVVATNTKDTLEQGQFLNSTSYLISKNGLFTVGFHTLDSNRTYLAIWYTNNPDHPVWLANRNKSIPSSSGVLTIDFDGRFKLTYTGPGDPILLYTSPYASNLTSTLLNTGNFVLRQKNPDGSMSDVLWQSFDHPTGTPPPGMKLGNKRKTGARWKQSIERVVMFWAYDELLDNKFANFDLLWSVNCYLYFGFFVQKVTRSAKHPLPPFPAPTREKKWMWHLTANLVALLFLTILCIYCYLRVRKLKQEKNPLELLTMDDCDPKEIDQNDNRQYNLRIFSFAAILTATQNFSLENKLGEGGFGPVFKGKLPEGQEVAIKRLSRTSRQGLSEFKSELVLVAKLQHANLVRLLGFSMFGEEKMLVYEFMPNRSLDCFIFDGSKKELLDWKKRFNIIEGIAQGVLYLHKYSRLRIVHRDLKTSNILLDENMNPKISDFGLARIFRKNESEANTLRPVGTYGYMPPEYAMNGIYSEKSDIYSFGVIILEIISGRKNNNFRAEDHLLNLVGHAWELWKNGAALDLIDTLNDTGFEDEILRCINIGLLCVGESASHRPTMSEVVSMLTSEGTQLPSPKYPAFLIGRKAVEGSRCEDRVDHFSVNELSVSDMVPR